MLGLGFMPLAGHPDVVDTLPFDVGASIALDGDGKLPVPDVDPTEELLRAPTLILGEDSADRSKQLPSAEPSNPPADVDPATSAGLGGQGPQEPVEEPMIDAMEHQACQP